MPHTNRTKKIITLGQPPATRVLKDPAATRVPEHRAVTRVREQHFKEIDSAVTRVREQHFKGLDLHVCALSEGTEILAVGFHNQANIEEAFETARRQLDRAEQHPSGKVAKECKEAGKNHIEILKNPKRLSLFSSTEQAAMTMNDSKVTKLPKINGN